MKRLKIIMLWLMIVFYFAAGFNHFYNPSSYLRIIPPYIPFPDTVNLLAGLFELAFALMLIFNKTRIWAAYGIILMLIAFLPVHIDMAIHAPITLGFVVTPFIAWVRLFVLQPLLILWAWWVRKLEKSN